MKVKKQFKNIVKVVPRKVYNLEKAIQATRSRIEQYNDAISLDEVFLAACEAELEKEKNKKTED